MPLPLLIALFLAFGLEGIGADPPGAPAWPRAELWTRASETIGGILLVAVVAFVHGRVIARRVERLGRASSMVRRAYLLGARAVDLLSLGIYGWIIHDLQWPRVVRSTLGFADPILIDDALILLPFLLAQFAGWWGIYAAERALRAARGTGAMGSLPRHLILKGRQSLGMVLPVAAVYALGTDLVHHVWPSTRTSPWEQPVSLAVMGLLVLILAPALVRLAWPTRSLPPGPLRDRLEHLAARLGFRCTDILVWDTNHVVVNAGVTGSLPWFRYVLLTDALIENLGPHEVSAVFGHEVGHIAHRHLLYFGFFLLGSLGAILAVEGFLDRSFDLVTMPGWVALGATSTEVVKAVGALALVGFYFLIVFGHVSRRFERQADVFGCRAVSCGLADCPPHVDLDGQPSRIDPRRLAAAATAPLCPVGIRIFINALESVALLNGMRPTAWSWRHGSIRRRVTFLEGLEGRPEVERTFQRGVWRMRLGMAAALLAAVGIAVAKEYWR